MNNYIIGEIPAKCSCWPSDLSKPQNYLCDYLSNGFTVSRLSCKLISTSSSLHLSLLLRLKYLPLATCMWQEFSMPHNLQQPEVSEQAMWQSNHREHTFLLSRKSVKGMKIMNSVPLSPVPSVVIPCTTLQGKPLPKSPA